MIVKTMHFRKTDPILVGLAAISITSWLSVLFSYAYSHSSADIYKLVALPLVSAITFVLYLLGTNNTASLYWAFYRIILVIFWLGYVTGAVALVGLFSDREMVVKTMYVLTILSAVYLVISIAKRMGWIQSK